MSEIVTFVNTQTFYEVCQQLAKDKLPLGLYTGVGQENAAMIYFDASEPVVLVVVSPFMDAILKANKKRIIGGHSFQFTVDEHTTLKQMLQYLRDNNLPGIIGPAIPGHPGLVLVILDRGLQEQVLALKLKLESVMN